MRAFFVHILASRKGGTLYIGATNDVARRVWEHRNGEGDAFTRRYKVYRLVYFETFSNRPRSNRAREVTEEMAAQMEKSN